MVIETSRPIAKVAKELGINEGTLGNWVGIYRREHAGEEPPLTVNERARLRELEREAEHARGDVTRYIEFWYNSRRRHSGLQYRTPQQVHNEYLERQSAA